MKRILRANARPDLSVDILWDDGTQGRVSFAELADRGGVCAPMRESSWFVREMRIEEDGYALGWPGDVAFSADGLWSWLNPEAAAEELAAE